MLPGSSDLIDATPACNEDVWRPYRPNRPYTQTVYPAGPATEHSQLTAVWKVYKNATGSAAALSWAAERFTGVMDGSERYE